MFWHDMWLGEEVIKERLIGCLIRLWKKMFM